MTETTVVRFWTEKLIAAVATAVAVSGLLYFPDRDDGTGAVLGGLFTLIAATLGLAAAAKSRPLPSRSVAEHIRLITLSLGLGIVLGLANLGANYGMAVLDSAIYEQMVTRWTQFSFWSIVVSGPITEEIVVRLVLMGGLAWIVARFTDDRRTIFYVALGVSALIFGVAHIFYGGVDDPQYMIGIAVKTSAAGLLLGWIFWRWGLPYSILCHCTANAVHLLLWRALF